VRVSYTVVLLNMSVLLVRCLCTACTVLAGSRVSVVLVACHSCTDSNTTLLTCHLTTQPRTPLLPKQVSVGAILEVLLRTLGRDDVAFSISSEGTPWLTRSYKTLTSAAKEVGGERGSCRSSHALMNFQARRWLAVCTARSWCNSKTVRCRCTARGSP
jgi:hypothetical protein